MKNPHKTYIGDVRCDAGRVFDDTSYFVTVGLSNTVQLRLLGKVFSDVGTPRVSFVLPNSALLLSCSPSSLLLLSFSECNKDVFTLFNLRVSSLTEPGLYQDGGVPGLGIFEACLNNSRSALGAVVILEKGGG